MADNKYTETFKKLRPVFGITEHILQTVDANISTLLASVILDTTNGYRYTWRELFVIVDSAYRSGGFDIALVAESSNKHRVSILCKKIVEFYKNGNSGRFVLEKFD